VRRLEQACDRFEAACKAGERPCIEEHLAAVPEPERPALLRELIPLEVDYRRLAGEQPVAEEFLARFPDLDRAWIEGLLSVTAPTLLRRAPAGPESSGNIMVCERGGVADVVKLLDFGLVKAVGPTRPEETLTQEGAIAGTPAYMSPEQASGTDHLDGRSDIYSLGAVAYFLLTGQPPFPRDRAIEAIVAHLHEPVRPLTELRAEVPGDLQEVVLRCLEKEPGRRFADVSSLQEALAGCGCARR
jgi:hypothetical protein